MIDKIMSCLSPKVVEPLHPTLGLSILFLKYSCIWIPNRSSVKTFLYNLFLFYTLLFSTSTILKLALKNNYEAFINFVQYFPLHIHLIKHLTFFKWSKWWELFVLNISEIETKEEVELDSDKIIKKYQKYSRFLIFVYLAVEFTITVAYFTIFWYRFTMYYLGSDSDQYSKPSNIFDAWLPVSDHTFEGHLLSAILQMIATTLMLCFGIGYDCMVLAGMLFFVGQFKALRVRCFHALDDPNESKCLRNIRKSHQIYINLLRCQKEFKKIISPAMFASLLSMSVVNGVCIINIVMNREQMADVINAMTVLGGISLQLLLYYWLANTVTVQSSLIPHGVFQSRWVGRSAVVRRTTLLLGTGLGQRVVFTAGPLTDMSLATYIAILKTSYSFYTLLSKS